VTLLIGKNSFRSAGFSPLRKPREVSRARSALHPMEAPPGAFVKPKALPVIHHWPFINFSLQALSSWPTCLSPVGVAIWTPLMYQM